MNRQNPEYFYFIPYFLFLCFISLQCWASLLFGTSFLSFFISSVARGLKGGSNARSFRRCGDERGGCFYPPWRRSWEWRWICMRLLPLSLSLSLFVSLLLAIYQPKNIQATNQANQAVRATPFHSQTHPHFSHFIFFSFSLVFLFTNTLANQCPPTSWAAKFSRVPTNFPPSSSSFSREKKKKRNWKKMLSRVGKKLQVTFLSLPFFCVLLYCLKRE